MLIVYDSLTGNVKRFIDKLNMNNVKISKELTISEPYILITYTTGFGLIPKSTSQFLESKDNNEFMQGVCSSGNRNWGNNFARSADLISKQYNVPVIHKFELSGTDSDANTIKQEVMLLNERTKMDSTE